MYKIFDRTYKHILKYYNNSHCSTKLILKQKSRKMGKRGRRRKKEREGELIPSAPICSRIIWSWNKYWSGRNWWRITFWRRTFVRFGRRIVSRSFLLFSTHARGEQITERERPARETPLAGQMAFVSKSHVVSEARPLSRSIIHGHSVFSCPPSPPIAMLFSETMNLLLINVVFIVSRTQAIELLLGSQLI